MIRLRNQSEQLVELDIFGKPAVTSFASALVPFNSRVKSVMARLGIAPTNASGVVATLRSLVGGSATTIATFTFANGSLTPVYSAVPTTEVTLSKGDVLQLIVSTADGNNVAQELVVDVVLQGRRYDVVGSGSGAVVATDSILGADADNLF